MRQTGRAGKQEGGDTQDRALGLTTATNIPFTFLSLFEGALGYFRAVFSALTRYQVCHSLSHQHFLLSFPVTSLSHAGSNGPALRRMRSCFTHAINSSFLEDIESHLNFGQLVVVSPPGLQMCMCMQ